MIFKLETDLNLILLTLSQIPKDNNKTKQNPLKIQSMEG